ncbi:MAG: YdeI/OmpD-associated family protein [Kineosporiaceae bacterium]
MRFRTTVELGGKTATGLPVPDDVVTGLGAGKRAPVVVTLEGYSYRSTLAGMGGRVMVPLAAEHREAAGVVAGQDVDVELVVDTAPRTVEVPEDLGRALEEDAASGGAARVAFDALAPSHRKEFVRWITEAKKAETRAGRVVTTLEMLREGRHR